MKTPREILLARHRAAGPKLEAIRRAVVTEELNHQVTKSQSRAAGLVSSCLDGSKVFWRELIFPSRQIWAGLAAIWILIFAANVSQRDPAPAGMVKAFPSEIMSFKEQQKLLNELLADRSLPLDIERPKLFSPRPRTQIVETVVV